MLYKFEEIELRSYCRTSIEALEKWARLIIDSELNNEYGEGYFDVVLENDEPLIKKSIRDKAIEMMKEHPDRFHREIDTLFLDEIIHILCKEKFYKKIFKKVLDNMYPDGCSEVRTFLNRLIPVRNKLSHSNPISVREAEMVICYCNDFIDCVKLYYNKIGVEKMFNVPHAVKLNDSLGNEFWLKNDTYDEIIIIKSKNGDVQKLNIAEKYSLWVTMDPSFERESYNILWEINSKRYSEEERVTFEITESMVAESVYITCQITQNKNWHKYGYHDHKFTVKFCVLPPIDN